jgi:molecular chaperone GrpE
MKRIKKLFKNMKKSENEIENEVPANENAENNQEVEQTETENAEKKSDNQNSAKSPEQQIADLNDKYIRLYSEYDNYRKRTTRERIDLMKTAGEDIFKAFLPILDDFERAIKASEKAEDVKAVIEGVKLIHSKLKHSVNQKGLEAMDCVGKDFDSDTMEAITNIPAPTPELKGKVVDEVEKGYLLNGKVIRFAKVVVGS